MLSDEKRVYLTGQMKEHVDAFLAEVDAYTIAEIADPLHIQALLESEVLVLLKGDKG